MNKPVSAHPVKVAWDVPDGHKWTGGVNYFINLASALLSLPERRVEPVVLDSGYPLPPPLNTFPILPKRIYKYANPASFLRHLWSKIPGPKKNTLGQILADNAVDLYSHGKPLGPDYAVPSLSWIPDFQHIHLPSLFSEEEIQSRNKIFSDFARHARGILLSSECAARDFARLYPAAVNKCHTLPFVACMAAGLLPEKSEIFTRYGLDEEFFLLPNQVWVHKNHRLVAAALRILRSRGPCPLVVCTGATTDYRNPDFFNELSAFTRQCGLEDRMRFLGSIPFSHVNLLMRESIAIINPSLFEGWSTTVEEAKSLGKAILLSDLPVHREQAPERGRFFDVEDAEGLAALMSMTVKEQNPLAERLFLEAAAEARPLRVRDFALRYENIVLACIRTR
ncbi:glycosyltransferase family 4 protein [Desulfovibrio sp. OttesenSCG-928-G11]|nr:glycosyltransferase family 4 protein [Desulfovibrio sp. OttesenSCG-928-G11]